jgi:hypothetical protein
MSVIERHYGKNKCGKHQFAATPFRVCVGHSRASIRLGGLCSGKKEGLQARAEALATPGGGTGPTGVDAPGEDGGAKK